MPPPDRLHVCRDCHDTGQRDDPLANVWRSGEGEARNRTGRSGRSKDQRLGMPAVAAFQGNDRRHLARPALDRL
eukprot:11895840-Alexandrium_andersonii.AAC.1